MPKGFPYLTVSIRRRYDPLMKVAPDLSGVTAPDTWLRAADTEHASKPRDPAEDLLVLDVSAAGGSASDQLAAGASAQDWADHIFSPLR